MNTVPILSLIVFLPLLGAVSMMLVPASRPTWPRVIALVVSAVTFATAVYVVVTLQPGGGMQYVERHLWIPVANIYYYLGVDDLSVLLVGLSTLLTFIAVIASWKTDKRPKFYFAMILLLATGTNGVFLALDFVLFYVFWELVLVPMYFLIAVWGGERRAYAAVKFFLYTMLGAVIMLVGILALYLHPMGGTLRHGRARGPRLPCRLPVVGLHRLLPWLCRQGPDLAAAHLAPRRPRRGADRRLRRCSPASCSRWGPTGSCASLCRSCPRRAQQWSPYIAVLAVISIVYGALVAFAQTDLKKLVAYSSVSHMGFAMLGIAAGTAAGLDGRSGRQHQPRLPLGDALPAAWA